MSIMLEKLNHPSDISSFTHQEMCDLADYLRKEIITRVSLNGGHL